jgi:hypothetical protein
MADDKYDDIQPDMNKDTTPHLDVSREPQTMSMLHESAEEAKKPGAKLDKGREGEEDKDAEAGNKTSLTWNE